MATAPLVFSVPGATAVVFWIVPSEMVEVTGARAGTGGAAGVCGDRWDAGCVRPVVATEAAKRVDVAADCLQGRATAVDLGVALRCCHCVEGLVGDGTWRLRPRRRARGQRVGADHPAEDAGLGVGDA